MAAPAHPAAAPARPTALLVATALLGLGASSCAGNLRWPYIHTQRYPMPTEALVDPLPPGTEALYQPGPEEVVVVRHADPVKLRPAGQLSAFPMTFYEKSRRVNAGSWVYVSAGGRAEILWPNGSTLSFFGRCAAVVGSQSRGEPAVIFYEIDRFDLVLVERDQVRLVGGSVLVAESGPFVVERDEDVLRVRNQSKKAGEVAFREARFRLEPGQHIDLPLLEAGGEPIAEPLGVEVVTGPGYEMRLVGEVEKLDSEDGVALRATGEHRIAGLGVQMELLEGEEVRVLGLRSPAPFAPPARRPPAPEPTPPPRVEPEPEPEPAAPPPPATAPAAREELLGEPPIPEPWPVDAGPPAGEPPPPAGSDLPTPEPGRTGPGTPEDGGGG